MNSVTTAKGRTTYVSDLQPREVAIVKIDGERMHAFCSNVSGDGRVISILETGEAWSIDSAEIANLRCTVLPTGNVVSLTVNGRGEA